MKTVTQCLMRLALVLVVVATALAGVGATAGGGIAESLACMEGVDTTDFRTHGGLSTAVPHPPPS